MPNIKSAKKRVRVSRTRNERNKAYKSSLRTLIKNALGAQESEKVSAVRAAVQKIDQAVSKGIMHKNTAARKKSALVRKVSV